MLELSVPANKSNAPQVIDHLSDPSKPIYADSQGSTTILPNGNIFLDYGQISVLKEFGPSDPSGGDIRWTARFGFNNLVQSYRGFKTKWQGFPTTRPDLFVEKIGTGCRRGYVSWNGATNVQDWIVYEGGAEDKVSPVGRLGYEGFETQFGVDQSCVQVAAVVGGQIGSKSSVVCTFSNSTKRG